MAIIKVTYNSISRRFNITSPNWVELESKLRSLYNIPATSSLIVSYSDEDGDIITLSSDLELKEILDQQTTSRPIKLILSTVDNESENLIIEDENDNVVVNKPSTINNPIEDFSSLQQNQQQTTELEEENVGSRSPSYQHVTLEEEEEPEDDQSTLLDKEKEKESEKERPENTNENKSQPENENKKNEDEDDDDDEIIFIISYPWARQPFFGPGFGHGFRPRFGFFGGPRFGLFDELFSGPRHYPFSPFNFYERPQCDYRSAFFNGYGWPSLISVLVNVDQTLAMEIQNLLVAQNNNDQIFLTKMLRHPHPHPQKLTDVTRTNILIAQDFLAVETPTFTIHNIVSKQHLLKNN